MVSYAFIHGISIYQECFINITEFNYYISELMKFEIKEENEKSLRFVIDADISVVNAIRRTAANSVQCFAIDRVIFYENTSAMFDEYIAHRIGLVPIKTPSKGYNESDEIIFSLEATGPTTVYSRDLKSTDKDVIVANGNIPIIKLGNEQHLKIEGKAILGIGMKHAKFQAGLSTFKAISEDKYEFYIESFGQMPPKEILSKAAETIKERLKEIKKSIK